MAGDEQQIFRLRQFARDGLIEFAARRATSKITRVFSRFKLSIASKSGSGFSNIPGPPPNGRSSTVLCRSCVQSRRLWIFRSSNRHRARV
jgi:hypothetical protein